MAREQHESAQVVALLTALGEAEGQLVRDLCATWVAASPSFRAFLAQHSPKVAKKLRAAAGSDGRLDVLLELYAAHRLLLDRRFTLEYEKFTAGKVRGPDFSVMFKTRTPFNVEVKRLRSATSADFGRWAYVVIDKLGQMPPSVINVLLIGCDAGAAPNFDVARAMERLRARTDRKDDEFFTKRGLLGAKDYLRQLQRLSAVLLVAGWERTDGGTASLWVNPQAKHPLPADLLRALA